ncbi:putative spermidine/putrescine transport system permease protein [Gemmobacter megaterium]|uniref:Putative spermidine/putrescine transport system permease protein n=1 Tax=Gemmobacter megaterium TaxID=1086013 RepID=A0A1N7NFQ7_9RHOB|nr:ABC transporter permease [Gemmobacter megaterium]GGE14895.1 ABC transporter permease [Gemmobacter megaterium]SIS97146.1 putative spermidine/putrescine transport system permease protein [Gemmobacter megaterium]
MTDLSNAAGIARAERAEQRGYLLLFLPALLLVLVFLGAPLGLLFVQSLREGDSFSLIHYARILDEPIYWRTYSETLKISLIVTVLSILLGFPLAYAAAVASRGWSTLILALVMLPFWTSVLVRTYAWLVVLQRRGIINTTLLNLGVIDAPLSLSHNFTAVLIGMLHVMIPFMVFPLYAALSKIPQELTQAGHSLGGGAFYVFRRVVLPLSAPGMMAGSVLVFILCLGFYLTPELLGGGKTIMVSSLVQRNVELYLQFGAASAVAMVLLALVCTIFWAVDRVLPVEKIVGMR